MKLIFPVPREGTETFFWCVVRWVGGALIFPVPREGTETLARV